MTLAAENFQSIDWDAWMPAEQATLLFVVNEDKVLLIEKKRGIGAGKINGPGGRIDPGEGPLEAAVREVEEELRVTPIGIVKVGEVLFQVLNGVSIRIHVFRADDCEGRGYLIMEYVTGETIECWCRTHASTLAERLNLFRKVVAAVAYAHGKGVIHRDIKPDNIMVNEEGEPKLLDFGIAHLVEADEASKLTKKDQVPMTPAYASPEQLLGRPAAPSFDIYALGLLLFELVTGIRPRQKGLEPADG